MTILKRLQDAGKREGLNAEASALTLYQIVKEGIKVTIHHFASQQEVSQIVPWLVLSASSETFDVLEQAENDAQKKLREVI